MVLALITVLLSQVAIGQGKPTDNVNVVNTPDVNVANTLDVNVVSTPIAEVRFLTVLCGLSAGQSFSHRTCAVNLTVPSGKIMKIERIDGTATPQDADLDKVTHWGVTLNERHQMRWSANVSRPSGTSEVRSFGAETTGYASFRIHVHVFMSSPPVLQVPAGMYITYRLIDGNIENVGP